VSWELLDIDHVVVRVARIDAGVDLYRSLGFNVAPPRKPSDPDDADASRKRPPFAIRHILFQPYPGRDDIANFVVLQCIEDQLNVPAQISHVMSFMLDTEGLRTVVCYSTDLDRTREAMERDGVETAPSAWTVEASWVDEELGQELPVRSQPCITLTRRTPFSVNAFQTETLGTFRHRPWTEHPNTARYLAGVTGVTDDVGLHAEWMARRVFGVEPEWESRDVAVIRPRDLFLRIVNEAGFAALYPGLDFSTERILPAYCGATYAVASLDATRTTLRANGIDFVETPRGSVVVPRRLAANTVVEFVAAA
jgi:hypothetical protein